MSRDPALPEAAGPPAGVPALAGVVRGRRHPDGWAAPGPRPPRPGPDLALWPGPGEDLGRLAGDWWILQRRDGHRWSLDDLASAWFSTEGDDPPPRRACDLGCGIGTVLLLVAWRHGNARVVGVEAQEVSASLARRSIARNGASERCEVRIGDLRDPAVLPEGAAFDLVTGTPPYLPPGTGRASDRPQRAPARLELRGGIEDYALAAARLLGADGRFAGCAPASSERLAGAARGAGLRVARWRAVVPREGKNPLFLLHEMRQGGAGLPAPEPPLVVRDRDGRRTAEMEAVRAAFGFPA